MRLTVVTINYGAISPVELTIKSVDSQTETVYEHLIVASGITEDQASFLRAKYHKPYRKFTFNEDSSLYNAMNIGLMKAAGNCVLFLNGGDIFYTPDSLAAIRRSWELDKCIIFRTVQQWKNEMYIRPGLKRLSDLAVSPGHQGFLAPVSAERVAYDESKLINADTLWMRANMSRYGFKVSSEIVARFSLGGISNFPSVRSIVVRYRSNGLKRAVLEFVKYIFRLTLGPSLYYKVLSEFKSYERAGV